MNDTCFHLEFTCDGTLVGGETHTDLDRARDIAFEVSLETGREVSICRSSSCVTIETVGP